MFCYNLYMIFIVTNQIFKNRFYSYLRLSSNQSNSYFHFIVFRNHCFSIKHVQQNSIKWRNCSVLFTIIHFWYDCWNFLTKKSYCFWYKMWWRKILVDCQWNFPCEKSTKQKNAAIVYFSCLGIFWTFSKIRSEKTKLAK